jgi:hypothetical protein
VLRRRAWTHELVARFFDGTNTRRRETINDHEHHHHAYRRHCAVVATTLASPAVTQEKAGPTADAKLGVVVADLTELTATVDSVDYHKRLVTLTGPRGNTVTVKAGPQIKNLDQVKVGDQLVVQHYDSVALFVRKSGEPPAATEAAAVS